MTRRPEPAKPGARGLLPLVCLVAGLLLATGGYVWLLGAPTPPRPAVGGPFQLTDDGGHAVTERSFRGRYVLVYFGYTSCPDVCPMTLGALADALDRLGGRADRVQPLFVTLDPDRDTPDILRHYTAGFSPRLLGLTGTPRQLRDMQQEYRVTSEMHHDHGGTRIDHSSVLYLMGPDGRFVAPIRADASAAEIATTLATYVS